MSWSSVVGACTCGIPTGCGDVAGVPPGMVLVPGGTFAMEDDDPVSGEHMVHEVTLSPYYMDRTEVTVAAYRECVVAGRCAEPIVHTPERNSDGDLCTWGWRGREAHPVNCVSWPQASAYCAFRDAVLPTEAQWEFAARSPDRRAYPWGDGAPDDRLLAWNRCQDAGPCGEATSPVGSFAQGVSPFGVLDMAGNVEEWVSDWYDVYPSGAVTDPSGPASGEYRGRRGGSWMSHGAAEVRASRRDFYESDGSHPALGFRCARGVSR